jgi:hypothetical protein
MTGRIWKLIEPHMVTTSAQETSWTERKSRYDTQTTIIEGKAVEIRDEATKRGKDDDMSGRNDPERRT